MVSAHRARVAHEASADRVGAGVGGVIQRVTAGVQGRARAHGGAEDVGAHFTRLADEAGGGRVEVLGQHRRAGGDHQTVPVDDATWLGPVVEACHGGIQQVIRHPHTVLEDLGLVSSRGAGGASEDFLRQDVCQRHVLTQQELRSYQACGQGGRGVVHTAEVQRDALVCGGGVVDIKAVSGVGTVADFHVVGLGGHHVGAQITAVRGVRAQRHAGGNEDRVRIDRLLHQVMRRGLILAHHVNALPAFDP